MKNILFTVLCITTMLSAGCNSKSSNEVKQQDDSLSYSQFKIYLTSADQRAQKFVTSLFQIMTQFRNRPLDTTVYLIAQLDGIEKLDTIETRIVLIRDTVFVNSIWVRGLDTLWKYSMDNPYAWINDSSEFAYESRSYWVTFTIGVLYGPPEVSTLNDSSITDYYYGLEKLKKEGIIISEIEYQNYLSRFTGDLLSYGDPFTRSGFYIWYEPAKRFIDYFSP